MSDFKNLSAGWILFIIVLIIIALIAGIFCIYKAWVAKDLLTFLKWAFLTWVLIGSGSKAAK